MKLGNYELIFELASGGMASVHVARQVGAAGFERLVVIKRVHRHLLSDREFYDMFRDEARISSVIRHPNVVPVIDVVETGGELFLALEYIESVSLSSLLAAAAATNERLPPEIVSRILSDMLAGLHAAHEAKDMRGRTLDIVHRDVSPQNVIIGADGATRLIDFGISKAATRVAATKSGDMKGKLAYMAPEQARRQPLDRRSDLFSAGIVLFEALTGQRLFHGDDDGAVLFGVLADEIPNPSSLVHSLPKEVDAIVHRALSRERDLRFQTAREFQEALEAAILPASAREVATAVERYVGAKLAERREALQSAIADLRASGTLPIAGPAKGVPSGPLPIVPSEPQPTSTNLSSPKRAWWFAAAIVAALVAVATIRAMRPQPASRLNAEPPLTLVTSPIPSIASPSFSEPTAPDSGMAAPVSTPIAPSQKVPRVRPASSGAAGLHRNPYQ